MTALTEAESKFFSSKGESVDPSLTESAPEPKVEAEAPAPAPEASAAPAAPKAAEAPPEAPKQNERHVPLEALHAERQKRQQVESERQQLAAQLEQMRAAIERAQQPAAPDPQADPLGALTYQNQQLQQRIEEMTQWRAQQEQQSQQRTAYTQFTQRVAASEQEFAKAHPDYFEAAQYGLQQYDKMLQASIPDPAARQQQIQVVALQELARVAQQGMDPAQFVYNFAKSMGYAPKEAAPAAPAAPVAPPVVEAVKTIQRGLKQQAPTSGGSTAPSEMSADMLLAIKDPQEFNKQWKRAFGR